ncbi:MAG: helix-turn-helix domain-containing protein, partial [Candidatus Paceibacterota bacterium]
MNTKKAQKEIGKLIQTLREEKGFTQKELARALKTTQSAVARIEQGAQNLSTGTLAKISEALGKDIITISDGHLNFEIEGGRKLKGSVTTSTSKNGAVGLLCASLLNYGKTTLYDVPHIEEVNRILEVLESIGVRISWKGATLTLERPEVLNLRSINKEAAKKTRSIVMLIGPLIHELPQFSLPQSGGCKLGSRTVRPHFYALEGFGVSIEAKEGEFRIKTKRKKPKEIILYESGDTVTENALMAAALSPSPVILKYASANYQVQELCFFLEKLGVKIEGIGTTTLTITGVPEIKENVEYSLAEDPTDTMFFIAAAIVTSSGIVIKRAPIDFLELELLKLEKMNFKFSLSTPYLSKNGKTKLVDITTKPSKLVA